MTRLHMVIPDAHAKPDQDLNRFRLAGKLAMDRKPDVIVNIGDWFDMPSLSSYDKGRKSFEGRRYNRDIQAGKSAQLAFMSAINRHNNTKREQKGRLYKPKFYAHEGNHEERVRRVCESSPELDGTIGVDDYGWGALGWEFIPYTGASPGVNKVDGVNYAHYFISGILGRPIGGEHPADSILKKQYGTCVAGHQHVRDFSDRRAIGGSRLNSIVVGCLMDQFEHYAGAANDMWWSGIVLLHVYDDGGFDPEFVSLKRMQEMYA